MTLNALLRTEQTVLPEAVVVWKEEEGGGGVTLSRIDLGFL